MRIASKVVPEEPEASQLSEEGAGYLTEGMKEDVVETPNSDGDKEEP